jgi:signal transduction histidine kinase/ActR/RegA family two-component response regulator/HAMP domain-containing protein
VNTYIRALPIRRKVTLLIAAASVAGLALASGAVLLYELTVFRPRLVADARTQADLIRVNSVAALQFDDRQAAAENLATLRQRPEVLSAALFRADGRLEARYAVPGAPPATGALAAGVRFLPGRLQLIDRIVVDNQTVGWLLLQYALPSVWQRLAGYGIMALVVLLALGTAGVLLLGLLGRSVTRPLLTLTAAAREISRTRSYRLRVPDRAGDEIGELTGAFNRMVATVEAQQSALRRGETRLRLALEAARMESWHIDLPAGADPGLTELLDRVHPDHRDRVGAAVRRAVADHSAFEVECRTSAAEERWMVLKGQVFAGDGGSGSDLIGVAQDVTEQRKVARQLVQSQRMEAIGNLAGGIAHDFNNLLTGMLGYLTFIRRRLPADSPIQGDVEQVDRAARRAAALTSQLLAYARRQMVVPTELDLNLTVTGLEPMIRRLVGEDVEVEIALQSGLGPTRVDAGHMEQVLLNLVSNARDAMPQGGTLRIGTRQVDIDGDGTRRPGEDQPAPGRYVAVDVSDNGLGMTPEVLARAFEPFFTTKPVGAGTGLGLAMCYGIVKQSGGHIEVETAPGRGSRFTILLPRMQASAPALRPTDGGAKAAGGSETVLLVEDDATVRELTARMLGERGYRVLQAASAAEAIECAERHGGALDLLLTDVVMPGGSGRELAETLTARQPGLAVLFMSGYAPDVVLRQGVAQESAAFLSKPFSEDELGHAVRRALSAPA